MDVVLQAYGRIDILVNNAGVSESGPVHELEPQVWQRVMDINLKGPFLFTRAVLPAMRRQRRRGSR